jgi:hypothetical protein
MPSGTGAPHFPQNLFILLSPQGATMRVVSEYWRPLEHGYAHLRRAMRMPGPRIALLHDGHQAAAQGKGQPNRWQTMR